MVAVAPLVGRELDLAVCLEQLKRVERGAAVGLLVRGAAGIGKSRLVAELAARARRLGHPVLAGRADDLDHGIPYALFRDMLARLGLDDGPAHDAAVVPAADALRATLDDTASADEEGHLGNVFAAGVELLRARAQAGPLVLILEDLHAADRESVALVALLARLADVGVLTVVTLRPGGAVEVERLLEQMADDGRASVVDLEALDRHDTQALVAAVLGAAPDDALTDAVHVASKGNPFFAKELALALAEAGGAVVADGRARLVSDAPAATLRPGTALLRRLVGGTTADAELAKVLAVFGRFPLRHLGLVQRLSGSTPEEVGGSFDRLVKSGLLVEVPGGHEFSHSIVRATVYDDIGPAERRRIHAAIAAELGTERRAGVVLDVLELATHVAASAEPGDGAAAAILLEAGRAVAASAPLVAAGHLRRAADLLADGSPARADALARQARALHLGGRPGEAAAVGQEALAGMLEGERRSATAALVVNDLYLGGLVDEALAVIDSELAAGAEPSLLQAMRVNLAMQAGRSEEAAAGFGPALAVISGPGATELPPAAELMAITHLVQYSNHFGHLDVSAVLLDRLDRLATDGSNTVQLAAHELVAFTDWRPGLATRIERRLDAARALRPDGSSLNIASTFDLARARLLAMRGEWDDALELLRGASLDLEQRGSVNGATLMRCLSVELLVDRGDLDEAAAVAARLTAPIDSLVRNVALVLARLRHAVGDLDGAAEVAAAELGRTSGSGASRWKRAELLAELASVLTEQERVDEPAELVDELDELAAKHDWPECRAAALRTRALVHGDVEAAAAALAHAEAEGWTVEQAHARLLLGELDCDPGPNLTDAYRAFDSFGAAPWRRRAAAGLRTRGLTVPRRVAQPQAGLTETEVQLVRLVRDGLSNRQVAAAMHYSTKTIEVYLSRVYAKTACASRLELIRAVDAGAVEV